MSLFAGGAGGSSAPAGGGTFGAPQGGKGSETAPLAGGADGGSTTTTANILLAGEIETYAFRLKLLAAAHFVCTCMLLGCSLWFASFTGLVAGAFGFLGAQKTKRDYVFTYIVLAVLDWAKNIGLLITLFKAAAPAAVALGLGAASGSGSHHASGSGSGPPSTGGGDAFLGVIKGVGIFENAVLIPLATFFAVKLYTSLREELGLPTKPGFRGA